MSSNDRTALGDRMKSYESVTNYTLYTRTPIVIRVDGRAFHTLTQFMDRPYDTRFIELMDRVGAVLMHHFSARIAYVQSDEASIIVCPYTTYSTEAPFSARVQKISSIAAAKATQVFVTDIVKNALKAQEDDERAWYTKCLQYDMLFDSRCFNLQKDEVFNYLLWRQRDCQRNAILTAGQYYLGEKAIHRMKVADIVKKLEEKGISYEKVMPEDVRNGRYVIKDEQGTYVIYSDEFKSEPVKQKIMNLIMHEETR